MDTVLLSFKEKIVYDGLLQARNIYFGGEVKSNLQESYMQAKQNNRIIVSLESDSEITRKKKPAAPSKNWKLELDELADGGAGQAPLHSPAFSLVKASVELVSLRSQRIMTWISSTVPCVKLTEL